MENMVYSNVLTTELTELLDRIALNFENVM